MQFWRDRRCCRGVELKEENGLKMWGGKGLLTRRISEGKQKRKIQLAFHDIIYGLEIPEKLDDGEYEDINSSDFAVNLHA